MVIWILFAVMTVVAALFVLVPAARRGGTDAAAAVEAGDVSVYRDQLSEIDRDLEAGLVAAPEADAARAEIGRRLLRAAGRARAGVGANGRVGGIAVTLAAIVVVPLVALGTYLEVGRPDLPDAPLSARLNAAPETQSVEAIVARIESHLAANPSDLRGWDVIAPVYTRLGRLDDAITAWRNAIRLGGPNEKRQNGLGEALTVAASGVVTAEARDAFEASLKVEPSGVLPRMYLALALFQDGRFAEAAAAWRKLIAVAKGDEPWLDTAEAELARAEAAEKGGPAAATPPAATATPALPGPSAADVEAAGAMSAGDRAAMIEGMVARLDERLKTSGGTVEEWLRLVRAQRMLGRTDAARDALARARTALAADPDAVKRLDDAAAGL